jgi:NAD(P)-dependent dehydrogenase (short-subunit alcohol dehydrogenase family)
MEQGAIIVTGASRGLGAAAARALANFGAPVVIGARTASDLEAVANDIRARDGRAVTVVGDVTEDSVRARLVETALQEFGRLRGLVNNAAMLRPIAPLAQAESGAWEAHLQLNLIAPVLLTKLALEHLRESNGRVINVSSGAALRVTPGWGAYDLSKAALNHFTRQLAAEEPNVISVAFRPGVVDTEMQAEIRSTGREAMPPEAYARFVRSFEEGELLPPEKPGRALAMLVLWAPQTLSGEYVSWDDPRVEALAEPTSADPPRG